MRERRSISLSGTILRTICGLASSVMVSQASSNVIGGTFGQDASGLVFSVAGAAKYPGADVLLRSALGLLNATAPAGASFSNDTSKGYDFIIELTDSTRAAKDIAVHRAQGAILSSTADAYTLVLADHPRGPFLVRLFWDRLMTESQNGVLVERSDAYARLVAALGHEIFGNVRTFKARSKLLEDPVHRYSTKFQLSDQRQFEIAAFREGAKSLERVIEYTVELRLPDKMKADFRNSLERERLALRKWESVVVDGGVSVALSGTSESSTKAEHPAAPAVLPPVAPMAKIISLSAVRCEVLFRSAR